ADAPSEGEAAPAVPTGEGLARALEAREADRFERALVQGAAHFDWVGFAGAQRALLTAVFETFCAVGFLIPPQEGYQRFDLALGLGCLVGASALYVVGARRMRRLRAPTAADERLARFRRRRAKGLTSEQLADFEDDLEDAARKGRIRRIVGTTFGVLNLIATGVLAGLAVRDRIDATTATSIATGTAAIGGLSVSVAFVRTPAQKSLDLYRAPVGEGP
ncbi:MAG: hypothetical protein ACOCV4_01100, partial [Myxococcota bacterium]